MIGIDLLGENVECARGFRTTEGEKELAYGGKEVPGTKGPYLREKKVAEGAGKVYHPRRGTRLIR